MDELIPKVTRPLYESLKILNKRPVWQWNFLWEDASLCVYRTFSRVGFISSNFCYIIGRPPSFCGQISLDKKYWSLKEGSIVLPLAISWNKIWTRKHSSRMRTDFCSGIHSREYTLSLDTQPSLWILYPVPRYPTLPLDTQGASKGTWDQAPGRNLGPEIPYLLTQWTHTCENITFLCGR